MTIIIHIQSNAPGRAHTSTAECGANLIARKRLPYVFANQAAFGPVGYGYAAWLPGEALCIDCVRASKPAKAER